MVFYRPAADLFTDGRLFVVPKFTTTCSLALAHREEMRNACACSKMEGIRNIFQIRERALLMHNSAFQQSSSYLVSRIGTD